MDMSASTLELAVPIFVIAAAVIAVALRLLRGRSDHSARIEQHLNDQRWQRHHHVGPAHAFNPATGLPMLNDFVDVAGNPLGVDLYNQD